MDQNYTPTPDPSPNEAQQSFLDRTLTRLRRALGSAVGGAGDFLSRGRIDPGLGPKALAAVREEIEECIAAPGGEVAARAQAADLGRYYLELNGEGRARFLTLLAEEFGTEAEAVDGALKAVTAAQSAEARLRAEALLRKALTPRRMALLTQFNALPDGVKFLVDLRADLLRIASDSADLAAFDEDLKGLLASWFDLGFLDLEQITWDSPASLLEKLIAYEAVHEIRSWSDLRNRLDSDRRCYALFHPRMPAEPLAFVEVALVRGMADNVQALLDESAPPSDTDDADTAIFYSISNTQRGLRGISFGEYLIKQVVARLSRELPNLKTFATLSPVPGFRVWLESTLEKAPELLDSVPGLDKVASHVGDKDPANALARLIRTENWHEDSETSALLERPLTYLLGRYFGERRSDGKPIDPVARFHLGNGARLERFNWLGDTSPKGLRQALGFMVNYRYKIGEIDANHEAYERSGEIAASRAVRDLINKSNGAGRRNRLRPGKS